MSVIDELHIREFEKIYKIDDKINMFKSLGAKNPIAFCSKADYTYQIVEGGNIDENKYKVIYSDYTKPFVDYLLKRDPKYYKEMKASQAVHKEYVEIEIASLEKRIEKKKIEFKKIEKVNARITLFEEKNKLTSGNVAKLVIERKEKQTKSKSDEKQK